MKVAIGSDHAGFDLKEEIIRYLKANKIAVDDLGCHSKDAVDYPDYAKEVAQTVSKGKAESGILICGTGIGMSIAANKVAGVRAALVHDPFGAKMSREHNNANVLVLGARVIDKEKLTPILKEWFAATFEGGRHERRVGKINKLDKGC